MDDALEQFVVSTLRDLQFHSWSAGTSLISPLTASPLMIFPGACQRVQPPWFCMTGCSCSRMSWTTYGVTDGASERSYTFCKGT